MHHISTNWDLYELKSYKQFFAVSEARHVIEWFRRKELVEKKDLPCMQALRRDVLQYVESQPGAMVASNS